MERSTKFIEDNIAVFLDLQRAFKTIDPKILIDKLSHYGVKDIAVKWFDNYLNDRKQKVSLNNVMSDAKNNKLGVPQGSILGRHHAIMHSALKTK